MALKIIATCSLCGHPYPALFDDAAQAEHMEQAHGVRFEPGDIRRGVPPHWREIPQADARALPDHG
jgi:hypothetical protein